MITLNNIVDRFEEFADNHFFIKSFSHGSPEDVDLGKFAEYPIMHLVYTGASYSDGEKSLSFEIFILTLPITMEDKVDNQTYAISGAEQCAEDIIADIKNGGNIFLFDEQYDLTSASISPLEEETKNVLAGVALSISITVPYDADACVAPINGITPTGDVTSYARRGTLRVRDGSVDVLSVRTINVTNGTLTDDSDGEITIDTGGATQIGELTDVPETMGTTGQVLAVNADGTSLEYVNQSGGAEELNDLSDVTITGNPPSGSILRYDSNLGWYNTPYTSPSPPPSSTDQLAEGTTNLYYTEARVSANSDVVANTAKVGITQAQADAIVANTAKVGITTQQATEITLNSAKTSYPSADATKLAGIEAGAEVNVQADWNATTGDALILNKPTIVEEFADLAGNSDDIPEGQTNKFFTSAERTKLSGIATGAEVNVNADWNSSSGDSQILNKPTIPTLTSQLINDSGFVTSSSGITDVVQDTTPQLGGDLDTNGKYVDMSGNVASTLIIGSNQYAFRYRTGGGTINSAGLFFNATNANFEFLGGNGNIALGIHAGTGALKIAGSFELPSSLGTSGQILQSDGTNVVFADHEPVSSTVISVTGATTLSSTHVNKYIVVSSASAVNITVPASASFDPYAEFIFEQYGAGQITIVAATGVTINSSETLKSAGQYAVIGLKRTSTNRYTLTGERELV